MTRSKQHQEKSLRMKRIERLSQEVGVDAAKLELEIKQLSEINASRLVNLHGRLSAGTYKINLEKTSRKLLSFELKLDSI